MLSKDVTRVCDFCVPVVLVVLTFFHKFRIYISTKVIGKS